MTSLLHAACAVIDAGASLPVRWGALTRFGQCLVLAGAAGVALILTHLF